MTSIPVLIGTINDTISDSIIPDTKNPNLFRNIFPHFWNLDETLNISKQKDDPHRFFSKITDCKNVVR